MGRGILLEFRGALFSDKPISLQYIDDDIVV